MDQFKSGHLSRQKQELNDFADGKITRISSVGYGKEDGMLSTECNGGRQPASLKDKDGKIWFPTQEGVAVVDPLAEMSNPLPPSIVIEEVLVGREHIDFRGGASVEPGQKDLEIRYTGISLIKSEQIRFQYKLEGHDVDWVDAGTRGERPIIHICRRVATPFALRPPTAMVFSGQNTEAK